MLYNRAVYDLASIVRLVIDRINPGDRFQVLALLKNIKLYLETCDVSSTVVFDEPLVTVNNLIHNIEDVNIAKQPIQGVEKSQKSQSFGSSKAAGNSSQVKTLFSTSRGSTPARPPVSRRAAVKRPPQPPDSDSDGERGDYGGNDDDASDSDDNQPQQVQEHVVYDETEWQPIDVLEQVLSATVNEQQAKTQYFFDGTASKDKGKSKGKKKSTKSMDPKLYLPDDVEYSNPTARTRGSGERKWPENAKWVCIYCRLITKNLKAYKQHLRFLHRKEDPCSCRFCRREMPNVELLAFHSCKQKNQCNVCFKNFNRPYRLRRHLATHFKSFLVTVTCGICGTALASATECAKHVYDDHETIVTCDSCMVEFDPYESSATDPARVYCTMCSVAVPEGEPEALPQNPNTDIIVRSTRIKMYSEVNKHITDANGDMGENVQDNHCDVCDESFKGTFSWKKHLNSTRHIKAVAVQTGEKCPSHPCPLCGKIFVSDFNLQRHIRSNHTGLSKPASHICKICGKELMTLGGYKNHVASHVNAKAYKCDLCSKAYNNYGALHDHKDSVHRTDKIFACTICGDKFPNRKKRTKHINLVHDNYYYQCPECEYGTRNSEILKTHITRGHIGIAWTKPIDYRQVSSEPYVSGQVLEKSTIYCPKPEPVEIDPADLTCEICDVIFTGRNQLRRHQHTKIHLAKKASLTGDSVELFKCDECNKEFVSLKKLEGHFNRIHNDDGIRYTCDECGKQISTLGGYKKHMVIHSGVRNFQCKVCDKAFFDQSSLRDHEAVKHMIGEFPCNDCGQVFSNRKLRYKHVLHKHHNYVYKCTECDSQCRTKVGFEKHFLKKHPDRKLTSSIDYRHDEPLGSESANVGRSREKSPWSSAWADDSTSDNDSMSINDDTSEVDVTDSSEVDDERTQPPKKSESHQTTITGLDDGVTLVGGGGDTQQLTLASLDSEEEAVKDSPPSASPNKIEESGASVAGNLDEADNGNSGLKRQQRLTRAYLVAKKEVVKDVPPSSFKESVVSTAPVAGSIVDADVAADESDSGLKPPLRKYSTRRKRPAPDESPGTVSSSCVVATPKLKQSK